MPAGRPKTEASTYIRLYASLPPDLEARLRTMAEAEERPINSALIRALRAGLDAIQTRQSDPLAFDPTKVDDALARR